MSNFDANEEERNLELAIKLSMQEFEEKAKLTTDDPEKPKSRQVMAIFDFEAVEENELTIRTGDILIITNDSNEYWYEGSNRNGETGFFPSNFVTSDFVENELVSKSVTVEIDQSIMDKMIEFIENSDPTQEHSTPEFEDCKKRTQVMEGMIEAEITAIDKQLSTLNDLAEKFYNLSHQYSEASKKEQKYNPSYAPYSNYLSLQNYYSKKSVPDPTNMHPNIPEPTNMFKNTPESGNVFKNTPEPTESDSMYKDMMESGFFPRPGSEKPNFQQNLSGANFSSENLNPRQLFEENTLNQIPYYSPYNPRFSMNPQGGFYSQNAHEFLTGYHDGRNLYAPNLEKPFGPYYNPIGVYFPPSNMTGGGRGNPMSLENNQQSNIYPNEAHYYQKGDFNQ